MMIMKNQSPTPYIHMEFNTTAFVKTSAVFSCLKVSNHEKEPSSLGAQTPY